MITCADCNKPMTSKAETLRSSDCGLPDVTLLGVEVRRCAACGDHELVLPKIEQLHRAIALAVIGKRARLTGDEVRSLRKYLGWSGVAFAKHMGVTAESVSRWENAREPLGSTADRLVRLMVVTQAPVSADSLDDLVDVDAPAAPLHLELEPERGGWRARGAA